MAPKASVIEAELASSVRKLFAIDPSNVSVNGVRKDVEDKLDLEEGFLKSTRWKTKSKELITEIVDQLFADADDPAAAAAVSSEIEAKPTPRGSNGVKRKSTDENTTPAKKRQRSEVSASPAKPAATKKKKLLQKKAVTKKKKSKRAVAESSDEEDDDDNDDEEEDSSVASALEQNKPEPVAKEPSPEPKVKEAEEEVVVKQDASDESSPLSDIKDDESEMSVVIDEPPKKKRKQKAAPKPTKKAKGGKSKDRDSSDEEAAEKKTAKKTTGGDDSDSSLSSVIDEPPKRKRKTKDAPKSGAKSKTTTGKAAADVSPDEAEVKKLQGQLVKCGVRKIWAFELKECGDDARAKIRHLKGMLRDIGMDGRFSEAKARDIKERRELEADLEAVQEMNSHWGAGDGRASRSRAKQSLKEESDPASEADKDDEDDEEAAPVAKSRGSARYKADLAFLGDESESD